jgi:hypothetical protein
LEQVLKSLTEKLVKSQHGPATVSGSKSQYVTGEIWEGVMSYELESGELPV